MAKNTLENKIPLISLIIPCYNGERYLADAIDSATKQNYPNLEIIIVDDGSTDNSAKIVKKIRKNHNNIKYIYQTNKGLGGARNTGIQNSIGKYFANLDADDIAKPQFLTLLMTKMEPKTDAAVPNGNFLIGDRLEKTTFFQAFNTPKNITLTKEIAGNRIPSTGLIRKSSALDIGLYRKTRHLEDYDFWLRLLIAGGQIKTVEKPIFLYRLHKENLSSNYLKSAKAEIKLFKRISKEDLDISEKKLIQKRLSDAYAGLAIHQLLKNNYHQASKNFNKALLINSNRKTKFFNYLVYRWPGLLKQIIKLKKLTTKNPKEKINI